ncbi:ATP-binding SpoIIE family protein phosphatase [Agarivorans sp. Z349TD_8]|uniref:ATP-binding SpoIIE family protein phosphatase n=1 Tax=Agarivorans sp. Z349TD_8 TaxID=3421434 RepID=UPI003D7EF380
MADSHHLSFLQREVKGNALVVDSARIDRLLLGKALSEIGYQVVYAEDGVQALAAFEQQHIDIVFIDVFMPLLDGYLATEQIKLLSGQRYTPVLFVTAQTEVDVLVKCIACGGDDVLLKPVHQSILKAKALGFERSKAIYNEINQLNRQFHEEEEFAERIFSNAVSSSSCADHELLIFLSSASRFSGDVIFAEYRPNGDIHVLLGDFTGHGLRAAIGAMPVADIFYSMTRKGYSAEVILKQINQRLYRLLPTGMFMAATFVETSVQQQSLIIWNAGMPDLLIFNSQQQQIREQISSNNIPLGIDKNVEFNLNVIQWLKGDHVLLFSDGVTEALNSKQQMFGLQGVEQAIMDPQQQPSFIASIQQHLDQFCGGESQLDDISMVEIPDLLSRAGLYAENAYPATPRAEGRWRWQLSLDAQRLQRITPIPLLMTTLQELSVNETDRNILFCIVSELYNNAFEHGVLALDSSLKNSTDGFAEYYQMRKQRAVQLEQGWVNISIEYQADESREFIIEVEDSGLGFDETQVSQLCEQWPYSGRGLALVASLCESLEFSKQGSFARAVYRCQY